MAPTWDVARDMFESITFFSDGAVTFDTKAKPEDWSGDDQLFSEELYQADRSEVKESE